MHKCYLSIVAVQQHCKFCHLHLGAPCLQIFKRVGWVASRLLLVPGVIEAFFDGGLIIKIFGMPATFAFAVGFILKAVGPALVIQCMFEVQQRRLGTAKSGFSASPLQLKLSMYMHLPTI